MLGSRNSRLGMVGPSHPLALTIHQAPKALWPSSNILRHSCNYESSVRCVCSVKQLIGRCYLHLWWHIFFACPWQLSSAMELLNCVLPKNQALPPTSHVTGQKQWQWRKINCQLSNLRICYLRICPQDDHTQVNVELGGRNDLRPRINFS